MIEACISELTCFNFCISLSEVDDRTGRVYFIRVYELTFFCIYDIYFLLKFLFSYSSSAELLW